MFIQIKQTIHDRLVHHIKTTIKQEIRTMEAKHVQLVVDKYYQGYDLGLEQHFITPVTQQKVQLLLRLAESLLQRPCFAAFAKNWDWESLIRDFSQLRYTGRRAYSDNNSHPTLGHLLEEVNISRPITSAHPTSLPVEVCEQFEEHLAKWLCTYLPSDKELQTLLGDAPTQKPEELKSWAHNLARNILTSGIDQCAFRGVTDPYTGNTLLHYALLFYQYHRHRSRTFNLAIIENLFARDACISVLNADQQHPLKFSFLTDLGAHHDRRLLADYRLLVMAFKNMPTFSELSYVFITIFYNFAHHSTNDLDSSMAFIIKTGKAHRLGLLVNFVMNYLTEALPGQNDTALEIALRQLLERTHTWPSGILGLRRGTHSSLRTQIQSVETLVSPRPKGESIDTIMLCTMKHIGQLDQDPAPSWSKEHTLYLYRPFGGRVWVRWVGSDSSHWHILKLNHRDLSGVTLPFPSEDAVVPVEITQTQDPSLIQFMALACNCTVKKPPKEGKIQLFRGTVPALDHPQKPPALYFAPLTELPDDMDDLEEVSTAPPNTPLTEETNLSAIETRYQEEIKKLKTEKQELEQKLTAQETQIAEHEKRLQQQSTDFEKRLQLQAQQFQREKADFEQRLKEQAQQFQREKIDFEQRLKEQAQQSQQEKTDFMEQLKQQFQKEKEEQAQRSQKEKEEQAQRFQQEKAEMKAEFGQQIQLLMQMMSGKGAQSFPAPAMPPPPLPSAPPPTESKTQPQSGGAQVETGTTSRPSSPTLRFMDHPRTTAPSSSNYSSESSTSHIISTTSESSSTTFSGEQTPRPQGS